MQLIKLTMMIDKGLLKTKHVEREVWINPDNVDYVWDWTNNDANAVQTVIHMNARRIYIKENFREVMKLLGVFVKKGEEK